MHAEGWYVDPFGQHDARWFSDGHPTDLVRDGKVESRDAPPNVIVDGPLEPIVSTARSGPDDLKRVDDRRSTPDPDAAWEVFDQSAGAD